MRPIRVEAKLRGGLTLPYSGHIMLDALLGYSVAQERGLVAGLSEMVELDIPLAMDDQRRVYLCSASIIGRIEATDVRPVTRRPITTYAEMFGESKIKRIQIAAGANKAFRIPSEITHVEDDLVTWFAIGDRAEIERLLGAITHLGKKRGAGRGAVESWSVVNCDMWGDGFPVARDGRPLRPLPLDWPGLNEWQAGESVMRPPYWEHRRAEPCALPL